MEADHHSRPESVIADHQSPADALANIHLEIGRVVSTLQDLLDQQPDPRTESGIALAIASLTAARLRG